MTVKQLRELLINLPADVDERKIMVNDQEVCTIQIVENICVND